MKRLKFRGMGKNFQTLNKIAAAHLFKKRYPLSVTHLITNRCNLRCKYCSIYENAGPEMNTEQILSMIDEFSDMGMRRLGFTGGEPLLRDDIGDVIDYSASKGVITTLVTNGHLVKQRINEIKNIDVIMLSFDGPPEAHDAHRIKGSYDKVMEAINLAHDNNIEVWTNTVIAKDNLQHMDFIVNKGHEMGFKMMFQPIFYYPGSSAEKNQINSMKPFMEDYKKTITNLMQRKKQGAQIIHSQSYFKHISNPFEQSKRNNCWAARLYCAVNPLGDISPCFFLSVNKNYPNGVKLGFKNAFHKMERFSCSGCYCGTTIESDLLFSFNPNVVFNTLKQFF